MPTCPSCGEENPERAKFCLECGAPLAGAPPPDRIEERKVVTVLFCDLVGFTESSEAADPEDVRNRLRPYHHLLRTEIERHGGTVEKFIGDAVMAVFGAPVVHEDDAERAVRAGLRILDSIGDLNEAEPGLDLKVRIGINTGEALVALGARPEEGEGIVAGDVVNTASRLQGAAPVNGIAVGEATYQATKPVFDFEELGAIEVKGKSEPVAIWRAKAARARFGTDLTHKLTTPLIGREVETKLLQGIFERSARDRSVHLVTIVGEPGVGKSRQVAELASYIDQRPDLLVPWRQGRCLPYGDGIAFWALGEVVKAHAGILESDSPDAAGAKLDRVVSEDDSDAPWLRQRLRPLVGLDAPSAEREENFVAWRRFLESIAERTPSIFVFEDLQWADPSLLAFLEHVVEYAEGVPMLLICTARPEFFERAASWAGGKRNSTIVSLSPLTDQETARLVSELLDQALLPAEVQSAIVERAGGNPLFAEEFVRLLKDRGILVRKGAAWELDREAEVPLPTGIQGLIAARLDTLSSERKAMLQDASVVGKVFWSGAVAGMGNLDQKDVIEAMHELSRRELVRPARTSSVEGQAEYAFWHALVRDVCYSQIPRAERADKHLAAAAWIEGTAAERTEDLAEILAHHYLQALELLRAVGRAEDAAELEGDSRRYLMLAGDRALELDVEVAEQSFGRALELASADDPERPRILARHAEALQRRGRFSEAAKAFEVAVAGLRAQGDDRAAAVVLNSSRAVLMVLGDPRARDVVTEAVAILEPGGDSPELISALAEQAGVFQLDGDQRSAVEAADRAIEMSASLGIDEPARALGIRGAARCRLGDGQGLQDFWRALELAEANGLGAEVARLHNNLGVALSWMQGPRKALETFRTGLALAETRGNEEWVLALRTGIVSQLLELGFWDEAISEAADLEPMVEAADDMFDLAALRLAKARILFCRGEPDAAGWLAEWAVGRAREFGQPQMMADCYPIGAATRQAKGDSVGALTLLAELEQTLRARDSDEYKVRLPEAVRAALAAGDANIGADLVDGVEPAYPIHRHSLATARMLLAYQRGDHELAAAGFAEAAAGWDRFEIPYERGQALLGQSRCLLALDRNTDAAAVLDSASEVFASLGARPALKEANELLAQTGGPRR